MSVEAEPSIKSSYQPIDEFGSQETMSYDAVNQRIVMGKTRALQ